MRRVQRRLLAPIVLLVVLLGAACVQAPSPTPTPVPAKLTSTATPATKPAAATPAPTKPAATPASKPAASADWKAEWDKTVAAAKAEGKVVVAGAPGELYRKANAPFEKAYPEIKVEYTGVRGAEFAPKILAERDGAQYNWDVHLGGWNTPFLLLVPKQVFDPLRPAQILPDVLDDSKWLNGFDGGWVDKDRKFEYQFQGRLTFLGYVNRDAVPEEQLRTVDDLLDPRLKGKISSQDPRITGPMSSFMGYLIGVKGEDWVRRLLSQDLVLMAGGREQTEAVVRGRIPIGLGVNAADVEQFKREGLTANVKNVDPESDAGRRVSGGFGNLMLVNRAPHPNAAKVYINWLLSKDGQAAWVEATDLNSRRLDVGGPAETAPKANVKYGFPETEDSALERNTGRAMQIAKEIIK